MGSVYRSDHVGSLLRPKALLDYREKAKTGAITQEDLSLLEDESILEALRMQRDTGISVLSDGEYRRSTWGHGFLDSLVGLGESQAQVAVSPRKWQGEHAQIATTTLPKQQAVVEKVGVKPGGFAQKEAAFLAKHAGAPFKITLPSPTMFLHLYKQGDSDAAYSSADELLEDLLALYLEELDSLAEIGVPYIQLDSLRYIDTIEAASNGSLDANVARATLEKLVRADNLVLGRAQRPGVVRGVHLCRGNHRSAWAVTGSYESIAEMLFGEVNTDRFLLEYDDERSGSFEPLRFIPKGKTVVLGLVTTKSPELESIDLLRKRVDDAAKFVDLNNLAIGTQCGFASTELGNLLTIDEQKRKLELVAETSRLIWG